MLRNLTQFKSVINGIENCFQFDINCPVEVAKASLFECLKWIGQIEDQAKAQEQAKKDAEEQKEVINDEPAAEPEPSV